MAKQAVSPEVMQVYERLANGSVDLSDIRIPVFGQSGADHLRGTNGLMSQQSRTLLGVPLPEFGVAKFAPYYRDTMLKYGASDLPKLKTSQPKYIKFSADFPLLQTPKTEDVSERLRKLERTLMEQSLTQTFLRVLENHFGTPTGLVVGRGNYCDGLVYQEGQKTLVMQVDPMVFSPAFLDRQIHKYLDQDNDWLFDSIEKKDDLAGPSSKLDMGSGFNYRDEIERIRKKENKKNF